MLRHPFWMFAVLLGLTLVVVTPTFAQNFYPSVRYGKRGDHAVAERGADKFWGGSRYGRTDPDVETRTADKFYGGMRYGKRSDVSIADPLPQVGSEFFEGSQLECIYTGVTNIYRCTRRDVSNEEGSSK